MPGLMDNRGEMRSIPQNLMGGTIADALLSLKEFGNRAEIPESIPLLGGMGLGDIFMGDAPEYVEDLSYGMPAGTGEFPNYTLDPRAADVGLLGIDALGVGAAGKAGARGLMNTLSKPKEMSEEMLEDMGRRDFLKKSGLMGVTAAVASQTPGALKSLIPTGDTAVKAAATTVGKVAPKYMSSAPYPFVKLLAFFRQYPEALSAYKKGTLKDAFESANKKHMEDYDYELKIVDAPEDVEKLIDKDQLLNAIEVQGGKGIDFDRNYYKEVKESMAKHYDPESPFADEYEIDYMASRLIEGSPKKDIGKEGTKIHREYITDWLRNAVISGHPPEDVVRLALQSEKLSPNYRILLEDMLADPKLNEDIADYLLSGDQFYGEGLEFINPYIKDK